jgi:uncharacterized protein YggU (UPF0235/DUF167 family)
MRIFVTVKPRSRRPSVTKSDATHVVVAVSEVPEDGKANAAVIAALAAHWGISRSRIRLVSGAAGRKKVVEVA